MHTIRIHGPWTCAVGEERVSFRVPGPLPLTSDSQKNEPIVIARVFHKPTGLDAKPDVFLYGEGILPEASKLFLNDQEIGQVENNQFRCEIREKMNGSNQFAIELPAACATDSIRIDLVALEIDE